MKTKFLILFCSLTWQICFGQIKFPGRMDSLKQTLVLAQSDEDKVMILSDLSYEYLGAETDSALLLAQQAYELAQKINFTRGEARALYHLGHTYRIMSDIPNSMRASLRGVQLAEENGFRQEAALCNYNTGALYMDLLNDYPKALSYFKKARQWNSPMQGIIGEACRLTLDINFGNVYELLDMPDSAEFYYNEALNHLTIAPEMRPVILNFKGLLQLKLKNYPEALALLRQAIAKKINHRASAEMYFNLASCFREMGQTDSCIFYAKNSLAEAEQIGYQKYSMKAATMLAEIYEGENNPEALRFYKIAKLAGDEVFGEQKAQELQRIITDNMQRQQEAEREKTAYENRVRQLALLGGLAVVLLVAFLLYRNNRQKQKSNAKLQAQNRELEIEASLERVRARALAMHKSPEIKDVAAAMRNEILGLGLEGISAATIWLEQPNGKIRAWDFTIVEDTSLDKDVQVDVEFDPKDAPPRAHFHKIWNRQGNYWVGESDLDDLYESVNWLKTMDEEAAAEMLRLLDSGELKYWWHPTTTLEKGRLNMDFVVPPPDEMAAILPKMAAVFDLAYRRFEDLQKAEAQAREAQIEAALERVRTRTMAMHKSEELSEVVKLLYSQIEPFGVSTFGISIAIFREEENAVEYWFADNLHSDLLQSYKVVGQKNMVFRQNWEDWKNKTPQTQVYMEGKDKRDFDTWILEETDFRKLPEELKQDIRTYKTVCFTFTFFKYGYFESVDLTIPEEENANLLIRFAKVFEQTYTRFLDLQKAEAQAREAQIEVAVERVRVEAMAMYSTNDFEKVTRQLLEQVKNLDLEGFTGAQILLFDEQEFMTTWDFSSPGNISDQKSHIIRYDTHKYQIMGIEILNKWKEGESYFVLDFDQDKLHAAVKEWEDINVDMANILREAISNGYLTHQWNPCGRLSNGLLSFDMISPPDDDVRNITIKMTYAFEQAYTRFLDLQRAEAQAREAQIEVALERVRAKTMAMYKSEQLAETAKVLFEQFDFLGKIPDRISIGIINEERKVIELWVTDQSGNQETQRFDLSIDEPTCVAKLYKAWKEGKDTLVVDLTGQDFKDWMHYIKDEVGLIVDDTQSKGRRVQQVAYFSQGFLNFTTHEPAADEIRQLLVRFARVFDLTYTRFLDLQRAEAQAREAQIEAALERVRSKTMAMHKTDELRSVIATVFEQVKTLGFDATACGLTLFNKEDKSMVLWLAGFETDSYPESYHVPYFDHHLYNAQFEAWEKGQTYQLFKFEGELKKSYDKLIFELGDFKHLPSSATESILNIETATNCTAFMKYGMLESVMIGDEVLSEQQADTLQRFAKVFEQTYTRFLDLQRAEAQAREAQIEAALERVRSRTMAMHKSDELAEVVAVIYQELGKLGLAEWGCNIQIFDEKENAAEIWISENLHDILPRPYYFRDAKHPDILAQWEAWRNKVPQHTLSLKGAAKKSYDDYVLTHTDFRFFSDEMKKGIRSLEQVHFNMAWMQYGFIVSVKNSAALDKVQFDVLSRFAKVFEQTYTRFLDLQKAEAQAREAQIEAALERVRASMMAMHRSDELRQVIGTMFSQLQTLGFDAPGSALIIYDKDGAAEHWMTGFSHDTYPQSYKIPYNEHPYFLELFQAWQDNLSYEEFPFEGPAKLEYTEWVLEHSEFKNLPDEFKQEMKNPARIIMADAFNKYGMVEIMTPEPLNPDKISILKRFSKVFEQTYTRFLDLQKAEAQAREAQIEVALERVRSRAIAMRHSDELSEAAELLYKEFLKMGVESFSCGYLINDDEKGEWKLYLTNPGEPFFKEYWTCPYFADHNLRARYESWKRKEDFHCAVLEGEENRAHHAVISKYAPWKEAMLDSLPPRLVFNSAHFSLGHLLVISPDRLDPELEQAMVRFAKVFDLTWRRFLDLQKAEARAREERIEAGLDRVRAEIASMRSTEDLERITPLVWRELTNLEVPFFRCGVFIMDEEKDIVHTYLSTPGGQSLSVLHLPFDSSDTTRNTVEYWRKQEVYLDNWDQQQFTNWMQSLMEQGYLKEGKAYQGAEQPPEKLALHFVPFKQGMLYVGNSDKLSEEQIELVQRLADTFAVAYARYEDFTKLEEAKRKVESTLTDLRVTQAKLIQSEKLAMLGELAAVEEKRKLEITLSELKATQSQLIQSEKLASLGELTAGIAHEIQNPLNFVNNFSELSLELAQELKDEIKKPEKDWELIEDLTNDLSQNQEKINHHGKRAASIVTGMLQHARTSNGMKEPTDLNALADEYLRLSYHGLRAKDSTFNAKMVTDFDPAIGKVEVIPQDIGRVFLNIINNAFYATQQRRQLEIGNSEIGKIGAAYESTVSVSSRVVPPSGGQGAGAGQVVFKIKDNGTGIPDDVKAKIFQPFFTTKPTGQGTGLGLSLAYDIVVKGHGGSLEVNTKAGEGTEFIIILPTKTNGQ